MTIDTETTGLDPYDGDEILTLAMILDIEGQDSPSSVHLHVKPQHKTEWPAAERVNHISPDSVANHKPFKNYLEAVQSLFDRTEKIVGWNVGFDFGFLEHEGVIIPQTAEIVDAMEEFGRVYGPFSESHSRWRLTSAADAMGYSFEGAPHTALANALATRRLYQHTTAVTEGLKRPGVHVKRPVARRHS